MSAPTKPVSLEDLLPVAEHPGGTVQAGACRREMARRLKALDARHQRRASTNGAPAYCSGCFIDWPCPDSILLNGGEVSK